MTIVSTSNHDWLELSQMVVNVLVDNPTKLGETYSSRLDVGCGHNSPGGHRCSQLF
jgi:hypothetical protein